MADEKKVIDPKSQSSSDLPYHTQETEQIAKARAAEIEAKQKAEKLASLKAEAAALEADGKAE